MRHVAQGLEWAGGRGGAPLLPLADTSSSLPPVPSVHCSSWPGPGLPDGGEASTEARQGALFCLCTVSAPSLPRPSLRPFSLRSAATGPRRAAAPTLHLEQRAPGQVSCAQGPQPSHPAVCIHLMKGKDTKVPSPKKTSASKGVESKWLSRLLSRGMYKNLTPIWVVWESCPGPQPPEPPATRAR